MYFVWFRSWLKSKSLFLTQGRVCCGYRSRALLWNIHPVPWVLCGCLSGHGCHSVLCVFADFLPVHRISCWECWGPQLPPALRSATCVFTSQVLEPRASCVCFWGCDVFRVGRHFRYHVMFLLTSEDFLFSEGCFVWHQCSHSNLVLVGVCVVCFCPFNLPVSLRLTGVSCRWAGLLTLLNNRSRLIGMFWSLTFNS